MSGSLKDLLLSLRKPAEPEPDREGHLAWKPEDVEHHGGGQDREGHLAWREGDIEHHRLKKEHSSTLTGRLIEKTSYEKPIPIRQNVDVRREKLVHGEVHQKLSEEAHRQRNRFGTYDYDTASRYKGSSFVNKLLRTGDPHFSWKYKEKTAESLKHEWNKEGKNDYGYDEVGRSYFHKHIHNMDRMTSHATEHSFRAYRGSYLENLEHVKLPVGHTFTDHGFTGVTLRHDMAHDFAHFTGDEHKPRHIFSIHIPKGTKGHYIDAEGSETGLGYEREFVLRRGTTFRVRGHSFDEPTNTHITHLTVHAQHEPRAIPEPDFDTLHQQHNKKSEPLKLGGTYKTVKLGESEDVSHWKPVAGHTETHTFSGGFMHDGKKTWYVKSGADEEHLRVEHLSNRLYRAAGVRTPETKLVHHEGKLKLASEKVEGARPVKSHELPGHKDIHKGFAADAWLGSWDVAGMNHSNLIADHGGNVHRIDHGGSLHRRAQGGFKKPEQWSSAVEEMHSLRDPRRNENTARMFSKMTDHDIHESIRGVANVSDQEIEHHAHEAFEGKPPKGLVETLKARRDHLASKINPERERHLTWNENHLEVHQSVREDVLQEKLAGDTYDAPRRLGKTLKARLLFHHHFELGESTKKHFKHKEVAERQRKGFTSDHLKIIGDYKKHSKGLNDALRGVEGAKEAGSYHEAVKLLDHVTNHKVPHSFIAYRGVHWQDENTHLPVGTTFTDHGYTGVSLSRSEARFHATAEYDPHSYAPAEQRKKHVFSIHIPKGTKGHYLDTGTHDHSHEMEFLLQRGTTFRVHGHSYDPVSNTHVTHVIAHSQKKKPIKKIDESLDEKLAGDTYEAPRALKTPARFNRMTPDEISKEYGKTYKPVLPITKEANYDNADSRVKALHLRHAEVAMKQRESMNFSDEHDKIVKHYKGDSHRYNEPFRKGYTQKDHKKFMDHYISPNEHKEAASHLDHMTSHSTEFSFTGYRGASFRRSETKLPVGHTFTDHGYTGISLRKDVALNFSRIREQFDSDVVHKAHVFAIHVPKGSKGHYLDNDAHHQKLGLAGEHEFLLKRGTTFRVRGHSYDSHHDVHITHVTVHEQPDRPYLKEE